MVTRLTWAVVLVATAFAIHHPTAIAQDAETFSPGSDTAQGIVRRVERTTKADVSWEVGDAYKVKDQASMTRYVYSDEYVAAADRGLPTEVWRSYGNIKPVRTTYVDLGEGPKPFPVEEVDWKANQTFRMKQDASGKRTIVHKVNALVDEAGQATVLVDRDPNLLPSQPVKVGATWSIGAAQVGLPFLLSAREKITNVEGTATLKSFGTEGVVRVATIIADITIKTSLEEKNQWDGSIARRITETYTLKAEATADAGSGLMISLRWTGSSKFSGEQAGSPIKGSATLEENYLFRYGRINLAAPALDDIGPAKAEGIMTEKHGALKESEILIARSNGSRMRLQVYDVAARKLVRTVLAWDGNSSVSQLAVSPDRLKVAFSSTLNTHISIHTQQVFVLNLETGKLDQVTSSSATGDGLEQPIKAAKTATLKGRVVWLDDEAGRRRDRHDGVLGRVEVDRTPCKVVIAADGTFELKDVPVGEPLLIQISGTLPNYSDGRLRGGQDLMAKYVGCTVLNMQIEAGTHDLGDVRINPYFLTGGYGRGAWRGDELWVQQESWRSAYVSRYGGKEWKPLKFGELEYLTGGFSVSPDGKHVAFARDTSGGAGGPAFFTADGKAVWSTGTILTVSYTSEGAWTSTSKEWVFSAGVQHTCGEKLFGAPALGFCFVEQRNHIMPQAWRQLSGHQMVSLATDKRANQAFFVTHFYDPDRNLTIGDAWHWDSSTDTLKRLTGFGDVIAVGGYGR